MLLSCRLQIYFPDFVKHQVQRIKAEEIGTEFSYKNRKNANLGILKRYMELCCDQVQNDFNEGRDSVAAAAETDVFSDL